MSDLTLLSDGPIVHSFTHPSTSDVMGALIILLISFGSLLLIRKND